MEVWWFQGISQTMANILIVDDDAEVIRTISKWLKYEGNSVASAGTGEDGWNVLDSQKFDVLILDWDLPDMTGLELLKRLRHGGFTTPVIMLTGHTAVGDRVVGLDSGANDYLTKPFQPEELSARIRAVLRAASQASAAPQALGQGNEAVLNKADLAGTSLASRYEFLEEIGEGGSAIVLKARHPHLQKMLAVKMLLAADLSEEVLTRFEREARVVSNLEHPNIVTVHDFGLTEKKKPYMVMEFVDGPSLDIVLDQQGYLPLDEALPVLLAVSDGLAYAHEHGILHRDVKPANVILKKTDNQQTIPKIVDFGLAKLMEWSAYRDTSLTKAQQVLGTPPYMSPELIRGKAVDERSDIYSFGCLMFEVLTGFAPFCGDNAVEISFKHLEESPPALVSAQPAVQYPQGLERIIIKTLAKSPDARYQKMRDLQSDLAEIKTASGDDGDSFWSKLRKGKLF